MRTRTHTHIGTQTHTQIYTHTPTYTCIHIHMHINTYTHKCTKLYANTHSHTNIDTHTNTHTIINALTHTCVRLRVCECVCVRGYVFVSVCVCNCKTMHQPRTYRIKLDSYTRSMLRLRNISSFRNNQSRTRRVHRTVYHGAAGRFPASLHNQVNVYCSCIHETDMCIRRDIARGA